MLQQSVTITNKIGIHARPAALLAKLAAGYPCKVELMKNDKPYNAKSMMTIMSAGIKQGEVITVCTDGEGEQDALLAITNLVQAGFAEK